MVLPNVRSVWLVVLLVAAALTHTVPGAAAQTGPDRNAPVRARDDRSSGSFPVLSWRFESGGSVDDTPVLAGDVLLALSEDGNLYALDAVSGEPRWQVATGHTPFAPAVFTAVNDTVFVASPKGELLAVDLASGATRWSRLAKQTAESAVFSKPTVVDGRVYVDDIEEDHGNVYALDAATGDLIWRAEVGLMQDYPLPVVDGAVVVVDIDGTVWLLDAATGELLASHDTGAPASYRPAVERGSVYAGLDGRQILAIDTDGAEVRWRITLPGASDAAPALWGLAGEVLIAGTDDLLLGVDRERGDVLWTYPVFCCSGPWIVDDRLFALNPEQRLTALDARDGNVRWEAELFARHLALEGDVLYAVVGKGIVALDPDSGAQRWRVRTGGMVAAPPLIAGDTLYAGSGDHWVYAFDLNGPAEAPEGFAGSTEEIEVEPLLDIRLEGLPPAPAFAGVWRATLPSGGTGTLPRFPGPAAATIARGSLASPDRLPVGTGSIVMTEGGSAEAGQNLLLPEFRITLENTSDVTAELLIVSVLPAGEESLDAPGGEIGLELLGGVEIELLPGDGAFVELHRLALDEGQQMLPALSVWPDILVVEEGVVDVAAGAGAHAASYGPADAALMPIGHIRFVRAENGPATVLALEIDGDIHIGQGGGCGGRCLSPRT